MSTTTVDTNLVHEGWQILVEKLGVQKATRFVVLLERGAGDSVLELQAYWGEASIDEIFQRVTNWKAQRQ